MNKEKFIFRGNNGEIVAFCNRAHIAAAALTAMDQTDSKFIVVLKYHDDPAEQKVVLFGHYHYYGKEMKQRYFYAYTDGSNNNHLQHIY